MKLSPRSLEFYPDGRVALLNPDGSVRSIRPLAGIIASYLARYTESSRYNVVSMDVLRAKPGETNLLPYGKVVDFQPPHFPGTLVIHQKLSLAPPDALFVAATVWSVNATAGMMELLRVSKLIFADEPEADIGEPDEPAQAVEAAEAAAVPA